VPSPEIAQRFSAIVRPIFARGSASARESGALAALRDALLPKLISGEIRVKDAERIAASVT
jgi:type I restriction enzyme S subunit